MTARSALIAVAVASLFVVPLPVLAQDQNAYEAGVAARQSGRLQEAQRLLAAWVDRHPDDADARVQLGYAELALGNLDAAQAHFEHALRLAPEYRDASDGLGMVATRREAAREPARSYLLIEGALSDLSGPAEDWREVAIDGEGAIGRGTVGMRGAYYRRFGLGDTELTGRVGLHPSEDLWIRAHIGGTPKADFRPELEFGAGFDVRLGDKDSATVLTLDGAWHRFPLQKVITINPGVVQYLAGGSAWITLRGIGTIADGGPLEVGALARADYVPAKNWRVFGGASNGPDTDLGIVTRVTSLFGGVELPVGQRLGAIGSVTQDWRQTGADRTEFRLGLKARF